LIIFSLLAFQMFMAYLLQVRQYQKIIREWLGRGVLGIGQRRGLIKPGEILVVVYNPREDRTITVQSMRGRTIFARFRELPEYRDLSMEGLRTAGRKQDMADLPWRRRWIPYKPDQPGGKKGALIQAVEAVERYLKTPGIRTKTVPFNGEAPPVGPVPFNGETPPVGPVPFNGEAPPVGPVPFSGEAPPVGDSFLFSGEAPAVGPVPFSGEAPAGSVPFSGEAPPVGDSFLFSGKTPAVGPALFSGEAPPVGSVPFSGKTPAVGPVPFSEEAPAVEEIVLFREEGQKLPETPPVFAGDPADTAYRLLRHVLPPVIFVALIAGALTITGLGKIIAENTPGGFLMMGLISALPLVSPLIGPGLFIVQLLGVLVGEQIAAGQIKPIIALPALLGIDSQVGGEFIPPAGMAMGEMEPVTINAGVPAVLFSRLITIPAAVVIACLVSFIFS
jgi:DNA-binding transcriptional regulator of glucitol operon